MTQNDGKYYVFKRGEGGEIGELVEDAIVLRKQDVFAAKALEVYADGITEVIRGLNIAEAEVLLTGCPHEAFVYLGDALTTKMEQLQKIADYFHAQAEDSRANYPKKLPD